VTESDNLLYSSYASAVRLWSCSFNVRSIRWH